MAEYIDRVALEKAITVAAVNGKDKDRRTWAKAICVLHDMPTVDLVPLVHGRWIEREDPMLDTYYTCSVCKEDFYIETTGDTVKDLFMYTYCPNCGAKMDIKDGGDNDAAD